MIYDTFLFFNELELLELRLHELDGVVDKFVLVEATLTHSGMPKPLHFQNNRDAFSRFRDKIIHVIVNDLPASTAGNPAACQRNSVARGLGACKPDDVIMVSDVDEIPRAECVRAAAQSLPIGRGVVAEAWHRLLKNRAVIWTFRNVFKKRHPFVTVLEQRCYMYFLNAVRVGGREWPGTRMTRYRDFSSADELRRWKGTIIKNGGWHFTYMGGVEKIQTKLSSFSHQEYNTPEFNDAERLRKAVTEGINIISDKPLSFEKIDDSYPAYLRANLSKYQDWIRPLPN